MTAETELYRDAGVAVTPTRFMTQGQTISMAGVTSVSTVKLPFGSPEKWIVLSSLLLFFGVRRLVWVDVLSLIGLAYGVWCLFNPRYALLLVSASGRQRVVADRRKRRVLAVAGAVEQALIARG